MIRSKLLKNLAIASAMGMAAATQLHAATTDEAMRQLEAIMADDQRRQASYDASEGFGLRAVRGRPVSMPGMSVSASAAIVMGRMATARAISSPTWRPSTRSICSNSSRSSAMADGRTM